jgi:hypothetical protein
MICRSRAILCNAHWAPKDTPVYFSSNEHENDPRRHIPHQHPLVDGAGAQGCTSQLVIPNLNITKSLSRGQNIIEFTAPDYS